MTVRRRPYVVVMCEIAYSDQTVNKTAIYFTRLNILRFS